MALKIEKAQENGRQLLKLIGTIDEDSDFGPAAVNAPSIVVDLGGVTAINSVGIREWIKWTKSLPGGCEITVRHCPKIVVDQINMVSGFLPAKTVIESFFVPYYSDGSGNEKQVLFMNGREFKDGKVLPPENVTDESGEAMEMDVIESKYFKFVANG